MMSASLDQGRASLATMGLRELRQGRVLSQRELAKRAGVATATILGIEQRRIRPHPVTLRKIAAALGVDASELSEYLDPVPPRQEST